MWRTHLWSSWTACLSMGRAWRAATIRCWPGYCRVYGGGALPTVRARARILCCGCFLLSGKARSWLEVATDGKVLGPFELHVPGQHNVLNATAAVAIALQLEVKPEAIAEGLNHFRGVDRRFEVKGCVRGVAVVDDYGHHPTEIRATLQAAKNCGYKRVHVIFQPHRYTRTRDLMNEFATAFGAASPG